MQMDFCNSIGHNRTHAPQQNTYTLNLITSSSMNADLANMNVVYHGLVGAGARAAAISSSRFR
jgi:hypothetical protein